MFPQGVKILRGIAKLVLRRTPPLNATGVAVNRTGIGNGPNFGCPIDPMPVPSDSLSSTCWVVMRNVCFHRPESAWTQHDIHLQGLGPRANRRCVEFDVIANRDL